MFIQAESIKKEKEKGNPCVLHIVPTRRKSFLMFSEDRHFPAFSVCAGKRKTKSLAIWFYTSLASLWCTWMLKRTTKRGAHDHEISASAHRWTCYSNFLKLKNGISLSRTNSLTSGILHTSLLCFVPSYAPPDWQLVMRSSVPVYIIIMWGGGQERHDGGSVYMEWEGEYHNIKWARRHLFLSDHPLFFFSIKIEFSWRWKGNIFFFLVFQRSSGIQNFFIISFNGVFISPTDFIFLLSTSYVCFPFDYFRLLFGISEFIFFSLFKRPRNLT